MERFFDYELGKEIKNERLRQFGLPHQVIDVCLLFAFDNELISWHFQDEMYHGEYDNATHASMLDFSGVENNYAESDIERFDKIFGDQCTFYNDICEELQSRITTDGISVDWVSGWDGMYIVFHTNEDKPVEKLMKA